MRLLPRSRFTVLLWAASLLVALTVACGYDIEPPPDGARLVESGPANPAAQPPAPVRQEAAAPSPAPATPVPAAPAPAASSPVAQLASPAPASSATARRAT